MMKIETGCTFNGFIHDFPSIRIDNFQPSSSPSPVDYYMLSHSHNDHFKNLTNIQKLSPPAPVIMSEATKILLESTGKIHQNIMNSIKILPVSETHTLFLSHSNEFIDVCLIPVYHCIGSTMFLIKTNEDRNGSNMISRSILYTGDIRLEPFVIEQLKQDTHLSAYVTNCDKILNCIYLDTTFAYREYNIDIPPNSQNIQYLINLIELYPERMKFYLSDTITGFEEIWLTLQEKFGRGCLVFSQDLKQRFKNLNKIDDPLELLVRPNLSVVNMTKQKNVKCQTYGNKYRFYIGKSKTLAINDCIRIRHLINVTSEELKHLGPIKINNENLTEGKIQIGGVTKIMILERLLFGQFPVYSLSNNVKETEKSKNSYMEYLLKDNILLPLTLSFVHSRHSSCLETLEFISNFNTKEVYGLTESRETWNRGFTMERYYGPFLTNKGSIGKSRFDMERIKRFGDSPISIDEPIEFINNWPDLHMFQSPYKELYNNEFFNNIEFGKGDSSFLSNFYKGKVFTLDENKKPSTEYISQIRELSVHRKFFMKKNFRAKLSEAVTLKDSYLKRRKELQLLDEISNVHSDFSVKSRFKKSKTYNGFNGEWINENQQVSENEMIMFKALNKVKLSWSDTQEKDNIFTRMRSCDFKQTMDSEKFVKSDTEGGSTDTELSDEESGSTDNTTIIDASPDDLYW